jgi:uncharacterized protein (DUF433 family)
MDWKSRIEVNPEILVGKPVIKGTRLAVEFIVDLLAQGWTETDILDSYPIVSSEDIRACLAYASWILHEQKFYPIGA